MWRRIVLTAPACVLTLAVVGQPLSGRAADLILQSQVQRYGLERAWHTQVAIDSARDSLTHLTPFVSSTRAMVVYEVAHDAGKVVFTERDIDPFGEMLGPDRAKAQAEEKVAELEAEGRNPKLELLVIPETTLYATTSNGLVQAINAETGNTRWLAPIGRRDYPTSALALNEQYAALTNGSTLYVLHREDGKTAWLRRTLGVPGAAPALSPDLVYVPTIGGALESFRLENERETPALYKFSGRGLIQPAVSTRTVAWATDRGRLYVANVGAQGLRYRLETNDAIASSPVFLGGNRLLIASIDGDLYCLHEMSGAVIWRYTTGEPISQSPVVVGDSIYLNTDEGKLVRVSVDTGTEQWQVPKIRQFVSASESRVYCVGETGGLQILNSENGDPIGELSLGTNRLVVTNTMTDRIFLASSSGLIQCLREMELSWPLVHAGPAEAPAAEAVTEEAGEAPGETPPAGLQAPPPTAAPETTNPFEASGPGADPFKTPAGSDPFGAAPKAAPEPPPAAGGANPLGGGLDDPFK